MAYKGTAAKSSSGASMSKYDVEVEARLKALEEAVKELKSHSHDNGGAGGDVSALVATLNSIPAITEHCSKDPDGVRRLKI
tara:strand:- start:552 stop:794 length:243 start_codon:yes stop_codon:yes gene_type:complete